MGTVATKTILVADDEPVVLEVAKQILQIKGFAVVPAADGKAALEICLKSEVVIDLLLTDIKMPRMNGVDLARCVSEHKPNVPIIFMSGYAADPDIRELLNSHPGVADRAVLAKPFRPKELVNAVEALLRRSEAGRVLTAAG